MNALSAVSGGIDLGSIAFLDDVRAALGILKGYGADAHLYIPGVGNIDGIAAGNYLDSAGVTAASVDNPVGLSLDALQAMTVGAPLNLVTYSPYNATITNGGVLPSTATATTVPNYGFTIPYVLTVGVTYKATLTWSGNTFSRNISIDGATGAVLSNEVAATRTYYFEAKQTEHYVYVIGGNIGETFTISSCVMEPIPGIHATQGTTANKPILRRGLLNLATWSMDVSNAAWGAIVAGSASAISRTPSYTTSPDGYPATRIQTSLGGGTATGDISYLFQGVIPSATICTGGIYIRSNTTDCSMYMRIGNSEYTIAVTSAWTLIPGVCLAGNTSDQFGFGLRGGQSSPCSNSIDVSIASAGLFKGTYTAQQILEAGGIPLTTSAAASSTTGKYWWQLDGSNDSLSLGAPLFQMSDDHAVIVGCTLGPNATTRYLINAGAGAGSQRVCAIFTPWTNSVNVGWTDDVTATNINSPSTYPGQTLVVSGVKQANAKRLRINGAQAGSTDNTVMGATTLTGGGAIGDWRPSGGNNWIGSIYPVIAIKGTVSDSDLLTLERLVGQLSGVSI